MDKMENNVRCISISINFLNDIRVRKLIGKYGAEVVNVLIYVLTQYSHDYQTLLWTDDLAFNATEKIPKYSEADGENIISDAVSLGIFAKSNDNSVGAVDDHGNFIPELLPDPALCIFPNQRR